MKNVVLITGSGGLIGSECVEFFCKLGYKVIGIDNNIREFLFGENGSVSWRIQELSNKFTNYQHFQKDLRLSNEIKDIFKQFGKDIICIIHCAAQPSHDWPAKNPGGPMMDFNINAFATLQLLEFVRFYCKDTPFIFTSTNKVYGDRPNWFTEEPWIPGNMLKMVEDPTRYEVYKEFNNYLKNNSDLRYEGIDENFPIDQSKHSVFGASKLAADIMVQEYGKYFDMPTVAFRGGCLTGPSHSSTQLHGFLSYLVKCIVTGQKYTIFGYKGKQVRDNIHSYDVCTAFYEFFKNPTCGDVYNLGGGRFSNCSMMEAISKIEQFTNKKGYIEYSEENRIGDHIWYISDMTKFKTKYNNWKQIYNIDMIIEEICKKEIEKL